MAAADEFPRGWTAVAVTLNANAVVTVPACAGISRVIDNIEAIVQSNNLAAGSAVTISLVSTGGSFNGGIGVIAVPGGTWGSYSDSITAQIKLLPGEGFTITLPEQWANNAELVLRVKWHDV